MATVGNNMESKLQDFRDAFFDSGEANYLEELLKDPHEQILHEKLLTKKAEFLYEEALKIINNIEGGKVLDEDMPYNEKKLVHLLAAIEDKHKIKSRDDEFEFVYDR